MRFTLTDNEGRVVARGDLSPGFTAPDFHRAMQRHALHLSVEQPQPELELAVAGADAGAGAGESQPTTGRRSRA